jgi:hypothetical protein
LTKEVPPKGNNFAFIVNRHQFPNPHLVRARRVSKTKMETLDRFKPNGVHTPRSMDFIPKPLPMRDQMRSISLV